MKLIRLEDCSTVSLMHIKILITLSLQMNVILEHLIIQTDVGKSKTI